MKFLQKIQNKIKFFNTGVYWNHRYLRGGGSGRGSIGENAIHKANVLNNFVKNNSIDTILDLGCGDGSQNLIAEYKKYTGVDIALFAILQQKFLYRNRNDWHFYLTTQRKKYIKKDWYDLCISLDVVYHLVEQPLFEKYMKDLFYCSKKYVIIYAYNIDDDENPNSLSALHIKNRSITKWATENEPDWKLIEIIENSGKTPPFFIYKK